MLQSSFVVQSPSIKEKSRPHVVLVNLWPVVGSHGGAEKVFCQLAGTLAEQGFEVTALCCDPKKGVPAYPLDDRVRFVNACTEVPWHCRGAMRSLRGIAFDRGKRHLKRLNIDASWRGPQLETAFRSLRRPDLLITFQGEATRQVRLLPSLSGIPVVTMFHSFPQAYTLHPTWPYLAESVDRGTALTVLLPGFVEEARRFCPNVPIRAIPNAAPQYERVSDLTEKRIVSVSRIEDTKRIEILIEAFALLKDRYPDWTVEFWGPEPKHADYVTMLKRLVKDSGLEGRFRFCGPTSDVEGRLLQSSIFAFPTVLEGFSMALAEAFSAGLPVVGCKDCVSVASLVESDRNGVLTEPTPEAFAEGLEMLMTNQELRERLGKGARQTAERFAPEHVWPLWGNLCRELIGSDSGADGSDGVPMN